jgi:hypothetical protein
MDEHLVSDFDVSGFDATARPSNLPSPPSPAFSRWNLCQTVLTENPAPANQSTKAEKEITLPHPQLGGARHPRCPPAVAQHRANRQRTLCGDSRAVLVFRRGR